MPEPSKAQKRRGLDYVKQLSEFAKTAPDTFSKRRTYAAIDSMMKVYGFSDADKKQYIRELLKVGCTTYNHLAAESSLPKAEICALVKEMEKNSEVQLTRLSVSTSGSGPSEVHIRLLDAKKSFNYPSQK